jgi:CMP-N-acetylneuraminic acid synthetase
MSKLVYAIIPARGGSQGVPYKNIRTLAGYPLIAWAIEACKASQYIKEVYTSSDSTQIINLARDYGSKIIVRPPQFATSESTDYEWVKHALDWFKQEGVAVPDLIVHVRTTTPLRNPKVIDDAISQLLQNPKATSLRSAHKLPESPYKMFVKDGEYYKPFMSGQGEFFNQPRQHFQQVYHPNGVVDIICTDHVLNHQNLHGDKILAFETEPVIEIDTEDHLKDLQRIAEFSPIYQRLVG